MEKLYGPPLKAMLNAAKKPNAKALEDIVADEPNRQPHLKNLSSFSGLLTEPWKATSTIDGWQIPDSMVSKAYLKKALINDHREIRLHPYLPKAWIGRAATMLALGYAELAVADAHRARLLVKELNTAVWNNTGHKDSLAANVMMSFILDSRFKSKEERSDRVAELLASGYREGTLLMVQGLNSLEAYQDAVYILEHYLEGIPNEPSFRTLLKETQEKLQERKRNLWEQFQNTTAVETAAMRGQVHRTAYPWIVASEIDRSSAAMKRLKAKFEEASGNSAAVAPSSLGSPSKEKNFGVFATQRINKGEPILQGKKSIFSVRNIAPGGNCGHNSCKNNYCAADYCGACCLALFGQGITATCCKASFCSESCKADALSSYHKVLCGKDFSEIYQSCGGRDPENDGIPLVMMKVLATAVQQNIKPLKVPCVAALSPDYYGDNKVAARFSLQENVIAPTQMLQILGIDVFTEARFDGWALQTLFLRIQSNRQSAKFGVGSLNIGINPMLSMFNHDCDPAATIGKDIGGPIDVVALRDIEKGEEICVSYTMTSMSELERRDKVEGRIGTRCECARCVRERKLEADRVIIGEGVGAAALLVAMLGL